MRGSPLLAVVALAGFVVLARPVAERAARRGHGRRRAAALATGSRRAALPALAAAVVVLVLVDPDLAAAPGFALSVLATGGLLVLAPAWREALARRLPGWLADALAVPAAAQVACGPVVVAISAELGLLAVPANLLAVPAVAPATIAGVVAALLAPVWLPRRRGSPGSAGCRRPGWCWSPASAPGCPARRRRGRRGRPARCCWLP